MRRHHLQQPCFCFVSAGAKICPAVLWCSGDHSGFWSQQPGFNSRQDLERAFWFLNLFIWTWATKIKQVDFWKWHIQQIFNVWMDGVGGSRSTPHQKLHCHEHHWYPRTTSQLPGVQWHCSVIASRPLWSAAKFHSESEDSWKRPSQVSMEAASHATFCTTHKTQLCYGSNCRFPNWAIRYAAKNPTRKKKSAL